MIWGQESSPLVKMHEQSAYILTVPPGQTANLEVVFDPLFHGPNAVGPIERLITVKTNI